jgi:hypothetical protein
MNQEAMILRRCAAALLRLPALAHHEFRAVVDEVVADLDRLPTEQPARAALAAQLIRLLLSAEDRTGPSGLRCLDRLVEMTDRHPPAEPAWPRVRVVARIMAMLGAAADRDLADPRQALRELDRLTARFPDDQQIQALATAARTGLELTGGRPPDANGMRAAMEQFSRLAEANSDHAGLAETIDVMRGYFGALQAQQNGDLDTAAKIMAETVDRSAGLQPGSALREAIATAAPLLSALTGGPSPDAVLSGLTQRPGMTDGDRAVALIGRGGAAMNGGAETDLAKIEAGVADLRDGVALTPPDHPQRAFYLASLALGVWHRGQVIGSPDDFAEAITILEEARETAGGPGSPYWAFVNEMLADVRRRRGDDPRSRHAALEGLRGYAWSILLQPDPARARRVAQEAAGAAVEIAGTCLVDHDPVDALRALDAGRGLMLFATTELRDVEIRLTEAARPDLADRWRQAPNPSSGLRHEVLEVLSQDTGLLDPPDLLEIQDALHRLGVDALVYLVPARPPAPGWAVIAPAHGPPHYLPLPLLTIEEGTDIERYLSALAARSIEKRDLGAAEDRFADRLDALCNWAWKVAMGPVLQRYLRADREARLVLIPMGDLARVPWQAARGPDGVHVVERAAISYAASARMLCDSAAAEPVRLTSAGLVLADPDTGGRAVDLPSARLEAYAIHQSFYPAATYVGRRPDGTVSRSGPGSADDVRRWLRADGARAGATLHLASHGVIETAADEASSRLVLAGDEDLTGEELIGVLAGTDHQVGLVVLAACHTGRSIHGYDEAYSLGTMFLAAGARSVLSTQWSVPDRATSLLMYMFHHFLVSERRPPWDALRRAQMWMLDGARKPPENIPGPLRRMLADTEPGGPAAPANVVAWAGFIHWGQ